jgi:hypothetical protein
MAYSWIGERMAEEHRRDLAVGRAATHSPAEVGDGYIGASLHAVEHQSRPVAIASRRPVGHQVGTLLIRVGLRLGGAPLGASQRFTSS